MYPDAMTPPSQPTPSKDERNERLAAALRENLKRRKAQSRSQEARAQEGPAMNKKVPARPGEKS